jgi:hypothetical protein
MDEDPVIDAIQAMRRQYPDWRIGQIICNVASWHSQEVSYVWDMEDADFVRIIRNHLA